MTRRFIATTLLIAALAAPAAARPARTRIIAGVPIPLRLRAWTPPAPASTGPIQTDLRPIPRTEGFRLVR